MRTFPPPTVVVLTALLGVSDFGACAKVGSAGPGSGGADGGPVGGAGGTGAPGADGGGSGGMIGLIPVPPPDDCAAGGVCKPGYLCTVANKCGKAGGRCTGPMDCQGDTYCCAAACRKDGQSDGICIPGNVGPGLACKGRAVVGIFSPQIQCEWTDDTSSYVASAPVVADLPNDPGSAEDPVCVVQR